MEGRVEGDYGGQDRSRVRAVIEVTVAGERSLVVTFRVRTDGGDGEQGEVC